MTNHLLRPHAPISDSNWKLIDDEARERLAPALAARRLIDFAGPHGWDHSAINLGRVAAVGDPPCEGVSGLQRRVLPLVEVRAEFALSRSELRDDDRGAGDADLEPLDRAAHQMAVAENKAVFHGWGAASITGIAEASPHKPIGRRPHCGSRARLACVRAARAPLPTTINRVPHHDFEPNAMRQMARQNEAPGPGRLG